MQDTRERDVGHSGVDPSREETQPCERDGFLFPSFALACLEIDAVQSKLQEVDFVGVPTVDLLLQGRDVLVELRERVAHERERVARELHAVVCLPNVELDLVLLLLNLVLSDLHLRVGGVPQVRDLAEGPEGHDAVGAELPGEAHVRLEGYVRVRAVDAGAPNVRREGEATGRGEVAVRRVVRLIDLSALLRQASARLLDLREVALRELETASRRELVRTADRGRARASARAALEGHVVRLCEGAAREAEAERDDQKRPRQAVLTVRAPRRVSLRIRHPVSLNRRRVS